MQLAIDDDLSLVLLHTDHADDLYGQIVRHRADLARWLTWPDYIQSRGDYLAFIERVRSEYTQQQSLVCSMGYQRQWVGTIGLIRIEPTLSKAEIGYWLASDHCGKGIVTRACEALIEYAFTTLNLSKIEASVDVDNQRSRALCERLGMQVEGTIAQEEWLNGTLRDHVKYACFRSQTTA